MEPIIDNKLTESDSIIFEDSLNQFQRHFEIKSENVGLVTSSIESNFDIRSNALGSNGADKNKDISQDSLNDILNNMVKVPATTSIVEIPKSAIPDGQPPADTFVKMLGQVRTIESYICCLVAFCIYNEHKEPFDISKPEEASQFARLSAKWRNYVVTGGAVKALAAYLPVTSVVSQKMSKNLSTANLHLEFLNDLFGGFNLPTDVFNQIDKMLTFVADTLKNLKLSFEKKDSTLDHFVTYYFFAPVAGTGGETGVPALFDCKIRTMFIHVDSSSWEATVAKSSVAHIDFNMNTYVMDTLLSSRLVEKHQDIIDAQIETLTGKATSEIHELISPKAIKNSEK